MPSCTRAPPESLMKTNGVPDLSADSIISTTFLECISPAEPPATVKSWLAMWTGRPSTAPVPVTTPSAGMSALSMPKVTVRLRRNSPISWKLPSSIRASMRSRAVSLPCACCFSMRFSPPPARVVTRFSSSSSTRCFISLLFAISLTPSRRSRCARGRPC